jgi:hypothetical protein
MTSSVEIVNFARDSGLLHAKQLELVLDSIPSRLLVGLDRVVLKLARDMSERERKRKGLSGRERLPLSQARGSYGRARPSDGAYIQLFIDNIYEPWPNFVRRVPVLRFEILNHVFFHELGHHVQALKDPRRRHSEKETDRLGRTLHRESFVRRHPLLVPWVWLFKRALRFWLRLRDRFARAG